jgi:peptidoglycan/xylan/chitin deacetylase (PgdA/CDA1 family)
MRRRSPAPPFLINPARRPSLLLQAHATHFVIGSHVIQCDRVGAGIGRVSFGRTLLRQMLADGHELGNHTW